MGYAHWKICSDHRIPSNSRGRVLTSEDKSATGTRETSEKASIDAANRPGRKDEDSMQLGHQLQGKESRNAALIGGNTLEMQASQGRGRTAVKYVVINLSLIVTLL